MTSIADDARAEARAADAALKAALGGGRKRKAKIVQDVVQDAQEEPATKRPKLDHKESQDGKTSDSKRTEKTKKTEQTETYQLQPPAELQGSSSWLADWLAPRGAAGPGEHVGRAPPSSPISPLPQAASGSIESGGAKGQLECPHCGCGITVKLT